MCKKFLGAALLLCAACSPMGASGPTLEERVNEQDRELRQIRPQQADTWNEVQAMRQEINDLKGQLAALNNAGGAKAIADRVRQHDEALRQVDSNMALNLDLGSPMATQASYAATSQPPSQGQTLLPPPVNSALPAQTPPPIQTTTPDSSAYSRQSAPAAPATGSYGLPPEPAAQTAPAHAGAVQAPSETTWGQADPKPAQAVQTPKKDISLALFDSGLNDYNARKYAEAQRSFRDFIKNYPNHSQIADAQYYLAECDFQRNDFSNAVLAYNTVITKYPKSSVAPAAYLKQGIAFSKLNNQEAAKTRLRELINKYPNSPEAARARTFLKTNK